MVWDFLIPRLVSEVFEVAYTLYILEKIDVLILLLDLFQQQSAMLGEV